MKTRINRGGMTNHGVKSSGQLALNIVDLIPIMNLGVKSLKILKLGHFTVTYTPYVNVDNLILP